MAEPSRSDAVEHLSDFLRTTPSFVRHSAELIPFYLPLAQTLPVVLDQSSLESERLLVTKVQDRAEFQYEVGRARRRDQDVWPGLTHYEEAIKVHRPVGNIRGLAKVFAENETSVTLAAVCIGTLVYPQPLYFSDTTFSPGLIGARFSLPLGSSTGRTERCHEGHNGENL